MSRCARCAARALSGVLLQADIGGTCILRCAQGIAGVGVELTGGIAAGGRQPHVLCRLLSPVLATCQGLACLECWVYFPFKLCSGMLQWKGGQDRG